MLWVKGVEVIEPILITWGWPDKKSRIQLQRLEHSPSLALSPEGGMVLNTEL